MKHLFFISLIAISALRYTEGKMRTFGGPNSAGRMPGFGDQTSSAKMPGVDDQKSSRKPASLADDLKSSLKIGQQLSVLLKPLVDILTGLLKDVLGLVCGTMNGAQSNDQGSKGEVYTRWGKRECRDGSELIYAGTVGGSNSLKDPGAAADYLCLPPNPQYSAYDPEMNNHAYVFGAQFVMWKIDIKGTLLDKKYTSKGVSCSVCKTSKTSSVIMIPGRKECYAGMTKEYGGYLMSGYHAHAGASQYICVDANADTCASSGTSWRKLLYPVESVCEGTLKCPPYINGAEMTCVVCSM